MGHHNTGFYRLRAASEHFKMAWTALNCDAGPAFFRPFRQFTPIHHRERRKAGISTFRWCFACCLMDLTHCYLSAALCTRGSNGGPPNLLGAVHRDPRRADPVIRQICISTPRIGDGAGPVVSLVGRCARQSGTKAHYSSATDRTMCRPCDTLGFRTWSRREQDYSVK
jgi:hypothetical protein